MSDELHVEPDAAAVIVRDGDGTYRVRTNHHAVSRSATWGMLWSILFGFLFFAPVFGMAVGTGLDPLMGRIQAIGINAGFQQGARDMLQPGTSALFLVVDDDRDAAIEALSRYGGTAISARLSAGAESELQDHLHGYGGRLG